MLEFKPYFYCLKGDPKLESLDSVLAISYESALQHFAYRKVMDKPTFLTLYEIHEVKS